MKELNVCCLFSHARSNRYSPRFTLLPPWHTSRTKIPMDAREIEVVIARRFGLARVGGAKTVRVDL